MTLQNVQKEKRQNAEVALSGTIPKDAIEGRFEAAITRAAKEIELPGFRKGKVPRDMVVSAYGERALWRDAAEDALKNSLEEILKEYDVAPIVPLGLSLTPVEHGEDVPFEIIATVAPTCTLPDQYVQMVKTTLAGLAPLDVGKEKEEAKKAFRTQARGISKLQKGDVKEGDTAEIASEAETPLTDDEAKFLGFETGAAFEHFLEEEAARAVSSREDQMRRSAVAETLISEATCDVPRVFIEEEARALLEATKRDVAARGFSWSSYLSQTGKDEAVLIAELRPVAEKRVALDLIFGEIIRKEGIKATAEDKDTEDALAHRMVHEGVEHDRAHRFAREQLIREKVWKLLIGNNDSTEKAAPQPSAKDGEKE